jgi:hypothetical protein
LEWYGIKEDVIPWKQLHDKIDKEIYKEDEDDENIEIFKEILEEMLFLTN